PDVRVARADEVADQALIADRGEADPGRLRELQHEHGERPRRPERPALDREHRREVAVGEPSKANLVQAKPARPGVSGRSAGSLREEMELRPRRDGKRAGPRPGAPNLHPEGPRRPRPPAHGEIVAPRTRRPAGFPEAPRPAPRVPAGTRRAVPTAASHPGRTARRTPGGGEHRAREG